MIDAKVEAARIAVERSRAQLLDTAKLLQQRVQPGTLARDAWESAKGKGADLAEDAVDAVRKRPYAAGGIVAAIALFIAREPIKDLISKAADAMTSDTKEQKPQRSKSNESQATGQRAKPTRKSDRSVRQRPRPGDDGDRAGAAAGAGRRAGGRRAPGGADSG